MYTGAASKLQRILLADTEKSLDPLCLMIFSLSRVS